MKQYGFLKHSFGMAAAIATLAIVCGTAHAASDGCDNERNDMITAELALCSVHAYNLGLAQNPEDAAAREAMREVIALKSTVMMQQMYKQYEYMDTMLKRFKVQLEKSVLLAKLQKAGAVADDSSSSGSSYSSSGTGGKSSGGARKDTLDGAEKCGGVGMSGFDQVFDCLRSNMGIIEEAVKAGNLGAARKQLAEDINTLYSMTSNGDKDKGPWKTNSACTEIYGANGVAKACSNGTSTQVTGCLSNYNMCLMVVSDERNAAQKKKNKDD